MMTNRLTAFAASMLLAATFLFAQDAPKTRDTLFSVINVAGNCQVQRPTLSAFEPAVAKMYPLGTLVRVAKDSKIILSYANNYYEFTLTGPGEVMVAAGDDNKPLQLIVPQGKLRISFVSSTLDGDVTIDTPGLTTQPGPNAIMELDVVREKDSLISSTLTLERGSARLSGPQYVIPVLKVGCSLRVTAAQDRSLTRITGLLGEFPVSIDNNTEIATEYTMKPNAAVKISRQFSPVSGREGVSVLIINDNGIGHASYAFVPGDPDLYTKGSLRTVLEDEKPEEETEPPPPAIQPVAPRPVTPSAPVATPEGEDDMSLDADMEFTF